MSDRIEQFQAASRNLQLQPLLAEYDVHPLIVEQLKIEKLI